MNFYKADNSVPPSQPLDPFETSLKRKGSIPQRNSKPGRIYTTVQESGLQIVADISFPVSGIQCELTEENDVRPRGILLYEKWEKTRLATCSRSRKTH